MALDDNNHRVPNYTGSVTVTSTDSDATLPTSVTFNHGRAILQITFATTGDQSVTVTDAANPALTGTATTTVRAPLVATRFGVLLRPNVPAGVAVSARVVALNDNNRPVPNYTGSVTVTSTDPDASLPTSVTFNHGRAILQITFATTGDQSVTVTDTANPALTGTATTTVLAAWRTALVGTLVSVDTTTGDVDVAVPGPTPMSPTKLATVPTDADTKIFVDGKAATLSDLEVEMPVRIAPATGVAKEIDARSVVPPTPVPTYLVGTVVSVDLTTGDVSVAIPTMTPIALTKPVTVATDANTKITVNGKTATLSDLKAQMLVRVEPATGVAQEIDARSVVPPTPIQTSLAGWIQSVDTTTGTVVVFKGGPIMLGVPSQVTVLTDSNTQITIDGNAATLGDLKLWMYVEVKLTAGTATSIEATSTPRPMPLVNL